MTIIVYGVGAVGGTIAGFLALSGLDVVGIARGAQLEAIRGEGLRLRTPEGERRARFPCFADPAGIGIGRDDMILLTMKSQDRAAAIARLRASGVGEQPVFCFQNGVANERMALRAFPNVHGATVIVPATYIEPGEVVAFGAPHPGIFDIGRYPSGLDDHVEALAEALVAAGFAVFPRSAVMQSKYGKLLMNLTNALDAAYGPSARELPIAAAARREGEAVLAAAGIAYERVDETDPRRSRLMHIRAVAGAARVGSSTAQSLGRRTGSIETDYLNGEIVLEGRLHGMPVPVNAWLMELGRRMAAEGREPGTMPVEEMQALAPYLS